MAELADALVLGSSVHDVQVQVLLSAPISAGFAPREKPRAAGRGFSFYILPFFKIAAKTT